MPKTVEELIEWLKANQDTKIFNLPDDQYECIDRWRDALAEHTSNQVSLADPRQLLKWIELTREILGPDVFNDIKETFDRM